MRTNRRFLVLLAGLLTVLLVACNGEEPAPAPAAIPAPAVAAPAAPAPADEPAPAPVTADEPVAAPAPAEPAPAPDQPAPAATPAPLEPAPAPAPAEPAPAPAGPLDGIAVPDPYDPNNRDSILARYDADKARFEAVLATGSPVLWVTDAIWCPKCGAVRPHVRELMDEYAGRVHFLIMDYDDPDLASYRRDFSAGTHPSLAGVSGGVAAKSHQGVASKEQIVSLIEAAIAA